MEIVELLRQFEEARETAEYHRRQLRWHQQILRYWENRERRISEQLPGLVEATQIITAEFERLTK